MKRCCRSVAQSCPTLCDPMDCSMPGLPVPHHLPEFAQVHVYCISDAIQPSHPLTPSSAFNLSQHQGLFQWDSSSHQVTKIVELQLQHQSFQMSIQGWFPFRLTGLISSLSKGLSGVFSGTTVWRHQFFGALPSLCSNSYNCMLTTGKTLALMIWTSVGRVMSLLFNILVGIYTKKEKQGIQEVFAHPRSQQHHSR